MKPVDEMTPEELRVACAEAMGWTKQPSQNEMSPMEWWWKSPTNVVANPTQPETHLPNYPESADAALTLAAALAKDGWTRSDWRTSEGPENVVFGRGAEGYSASATDPHAFATALCRAFLKTRDSMKETR